MNNYETIRAKVIEAVPEIMELALPEPGSPLECGVRIEALKPVFMWERTANTANEEVYRKGVENRYLYKFTQRLKEVEREVLKGRPIRLADVLLTLPEPIGLSLWPTTLSIGNGVIGRCEWNLLKDDLREQSPETLEFLAKLLK